MIDFLQVLFDGFFSIVLKTVVSGEAIALLLISAFILALVFNLIYVLIGDK